MSVCVWSSHTLSIGTERWVSLMRSPCATRSLFSFSTRSRSRMRFCMSLIMRAWRVKFVESCNHHESATSQERELGCDLGWAGQRDERTLDLKLKVLIHMLLAYDSTACFMDGAASRFSAW